MNKLFIISLVGTFVWLSHPSRSLAQTGLVDPRKTEYVCVLSRAVNFTVDQKIEGIGTVEANGTVAVLPCEAASLRQDRLIDADYAVLEKMQLQRMFFSILKTRPNSSVEARSTIAGFQKLAKEVCGRHPKIALLPLDWKTNESGGVILKTCSAP